MTFGSTPYCPENLSINSFICCEVKVGWGMGVPAFAVGFGVAKGVGTEVASGVGVWVEDVVGDETGVWLTPKTLSLERVK